MGEVFRADDLTLDQPVALKFLPEEVAADPDRLAQFHAELRTARQVSHKNVCRLYDLGEADGRPFLTMEYVDGEDLASLLRRIGRIPQDKAIEIARQLCAGLSAAHERGVLHRDLKPANIMIDGDGNVRIADFGLAVAAGDTTASRAGTPQYMAPELLAGGQASVRTDIYALGLVLFELFTGRRPYEAKTLNDLVAMQQSGRISTPSSVVRDLDPAVERVILRCLESDPTLRPGSALAVAAALPGGDPLAAALAAGETPSPEMVAAAGETSAVRPALGLSLFAAIILGILTVACAVGQDALHRQNPDGQGRRRPRGSRARDADQAGLHRSAGRHGARIPGAAGLHLLRAAHRSLREPLGRPLERLFPVAAVLVSHQPARPRDTRGRMDASVRRSADDGLRHDVGRAGRPGPPHPVHHGDAAGGRASGHARAHGLESLLRRCRSRREHIQAGAVAVGPQRLRRRAQGVGRADAGPARHHAAGRSRGLPRPAGVLSDRRAVDPAPPGSAAGTDRQERHSFRALSDRLRALDWRVVAGALQHQERTWRSTRRHTYRVRAGWHHVRRLGAGREALAGAADRARSLSRRLRGQPAAERGDHVADIRRARTVCPPLQPRDPDVVEPPARRPFPRSARRPRHPRRHRRRGRCRACPMRADAVAGAVRGRAAAAARRQPRFPAHDPARAVGAAAYAAKRAVQTAC